MLLSFFRQFLNSIEGCSAGNTWDCASWVDGPIGVGPIDAAAGPIDVYPIGAGAIGAGPIGV